MRRRPLAAAFTQSDGTARDTQASRPIMPAAGRRLQQWSRETHDPLAGQARPLRRPRAVAPAAASAGGATSRTRTAYASFVRFR